MVRHLLAADLRRSRRWLLLWILVAAAGAVLEQASLRAAQPSRAYEMLELATLLVWLADGLLMAALITLLVQALQIRVPCCLSRPKRRRRGTMDAAAAMKDGSTCF